MEPWQSQIISLSLPLGPAAILAYVSKSRSLFVGALLGSISGLMLSPFVMADFDGNSTLRDQIFAHVAVDLPYVAICATIGAMIGYLFGRFYNSK